MSYFRSFPRTLSLIAAVLVLALIGFSSTGFAQKPQLSPSDTVREFYKAMREKRFREAFALSIYKPAIEGLSDQEFQSLRPQFKNLKDKEFDALRPTYRGLSPQEFEDLRPDFDNMAAVIPDKVEINGEQISGDIATVFVKVASLEDPAAKPEPVTLIRVDGVWIIGTKEDQEVVKKACNNFFFKARIDTHHGEVTSMMARLSVAELIYSQQHNGVFGDLPALIAAGLIPKDVEGTESTGYHFRLTVGKDAKTYTVAAEPAQYGRTGRLSFFMDHTGVRSGDNGGKPLNVKGEPN
ncbi:MAG: hypothetical protein JWM21_3631 [Acidobacteria bacterium]|nr:hypothetical protein [Acidobacteriota bacterium]